MSDCNTCGIGYILPSGHCDHCDVKHEQSNRITREQLRTTYLRCVEETSSFVDTKEAWIGFIVGFRTYERMATAMGKNLTQQDVDRFVPVVKKEDVP